MSQFDSMCVAKLKNLTIHSAYCIDDAENAQSFRAEMNRHKQYVGYRHASSNLLHRKSKLPGFDKSGTFDS
jgi:hypothetical protein